MPPLERMAVSAGPLIEADRYTAIDTCMEAIKQAPNDLRSGVVGMMAGYFYPQEA